LLDDSERAEGALRDLRKKFSTSNVRFVKKVSARQMAYLGERGGPSAGSKPKKKRANHTN